MKAPLSTEIRAVFQKDGADAAEVRYRDIAAGERDAYEFDTRGMVDIGAEYARAGDIAAAQVFFRIANDMSLAELQRSGVGARVAAVGDSAERPGGRPSGPGRAARPDSPRHEPGPARSDLARFAGVYGDPEQQTTPRNIFVTETCDGHLQFGAMWGDAAPWVMRSIGDAEFVQARLQPHDTEPLRLEFHLAADGAAAAVTHTLTARHRPQRLARLGELPEQRRRECP